MDLLYESVFSKRPIIPLDTDHDTSLTYGCTKKTNEVRKELDHTTTSHKQLLPQAIGVQKESCYNGREEKEIYRGRYGALKNDYRQTKLIHS